MPSLYALLIAINDYPSRPLEGCINDLHKVSHFLNSYSQTTAYSLYTKKLINEDATKVGIIEGFDHFLKAETGDTCLLFYAGHGARSASPKPFWHLDHKHQMESFTCYYQTDEGHHHLMDKELSYLIWKVTKNKQVHFLAITDCCHSGNIMRGPKEIDGNQFRIRKSDGLKIPPGIGDFLGVTHYQEVEPGQYSPPRGRYIHLAAAKDEEYAKEVSVNGQAGGLFTYCLLETLQRFGSFLTYDKLLDIINLRIKSIVSDQSPNLEATMPTDKHLLFLSGKDTLLSSSFLISHHKEKGWILNAGQMNGINQGSSGETIKVKLSDGEMLTLDEIHPTTSKVAGMEGRNPYQIYPAELITTAENALSIPIEITADSDKTVRDGLLRLQEGRPSSLFTLVEAITDPSLSLSVSKDSYRIARNWGDEVLYEREGLQSPFSLESLWQKLHLVVRWLKVLSLTNRNLAVIPPPIDIEFTKVSGPTEQVLQEALTQEDLAAPIELRYKYAQGQWHNPGFQLKLTNVSKKPLWISLVYLQANFAISNELMPKELLRKGEVAWALQLAGDHSFRTILLEVEDHFLLNATETIEEYIKIIVSSEELNTDLFNQPALPEDHLPTEPRLQKKKQNNDAFWWAKTISLKVHRSLASLGQ